ncbi:hypothetical protein K2X85_18570 [bacterium]|nr:hypothetical protein [bacterium]
MMTAILTICLSVCSAEPASEPDVQDLYLLDPRGVVFIRLHLQRASGPYQQVWGDALWSLFEQADRDQDLQISYSEFAQVPAAEFRARDGVSGLSAPNDISHLDFDRSPRDGKVSFDEIVATLGANCLRFNLSLKGRSLGTVDQVLTRLDLDRDGGLSLEECQSAYDRLNVLDFNDDEWISYGETAMTATVMSSDESRPNTTNLSRVPVLAPVPGTPTEAIRELATQFYASSTSEKNSAAMPAFPTRPDLEIRVQLDSTPDGPRGIDAKSLEPGIWEIKSEGDARSAVRRPGMEIHLSLAPPPNDSAMEKALKNQFDAIDRDDNDYIDANESQSLGGSLFRSADRDRNDQLYFPELLEYTKRANEIRHSQVVLDSVMVGSAMFDLLDPDQDGKLSTVEMKSFGRRSSEWDRNRDGKLDSTEIPRSYTFLIGTAAGNVNSSNQVLAAVQANSRMPSANTQRTFSSPFDFMDSNGDNLISKREFVGQLEKFRQMDRDGDGFISRDESKAPTTPQSK